MATVPPIHNGCRYKKWEKGKDPDPKLNAKPEPGPSARGGPPGVLARPVPDFRPVSGEKGLLGPALNWNDLKAKPR